MRLSPRIRRRSGLTMIEVLVATVILSAILAMSSYLVWSSSKTITSSEVGIQLEMQAREFLTNLEKELRQTKMDKIDIIDWTQIPVYNPAALVNSPGTVLGAKVPFLAGFPSAYLPADDLSIRDPITGVYRPGVAPYHAIRFKIPGTTMDLTANKVTASYDFNPKNFNLKAYKATGSNDANYTTEIMYWFEIDGDKTLGTGLTAGEGLPNQPGYANGLAPDRIDNNKNGVTDEGVIKRMETTFDVNGNAISRKLSTVLRDVAWDPFNNPGAAAGAPNGAPSFVWMFFASDYQGNLYNGAVKRIFVTITLEKQDPQHVGHPNFNFKKTVANYIELRGI